MPDIGAPELILVLVVALIVLGPKRLPEMGASLGRSIREFRHAVTETTDAVKVGASDPIAATPPPAPAAPVTPVAPPPAEPVAPPPDPSGPGV